MAAIARSERIETQPGKTLSRGVYVFCGWAKPRPEFEKVPGIQAPWPDPWAVLHTADRRPALGYYDERDPKVTAWRLEKMREGRVDFGVYQVGWSYIHSAPERMPRWEIAKGKLNPLLYSHCADAHRAPDPKFALSFFDVLAQRSLDSYWQDRINQGWTRATFTASVALFAKSAGRYMDSPAYHRVGGRPVLFWGYPHLLTYWERPFRYSPKEILELVRSSIGEVYIVATAVEPSVLPNLKAWGFDAFTEYLWYADSWRGAAATYRSKWREGVQIAREQGIHYWVPATAGFDARGWGIPNETDRRVPFVPTPTEFEAHMREAQRFALENFDVTQGQIVTYAWNEFGEGGVIEPMAPGMLHEGDSMLRAFAAATR
jgi:hypothetical protein